MRVLFAVPLACLGFAASGARAEDGLSLSGSVRGRFESVDGQTRPGFNAADDIYSLRTTALAAWTAPAWRAALEVYDSRAWGGNARTPLTTGEVNTAEVVQAYVAADLPAGPGGKLSVGAGRMMLNIASRRLIAADDYRNTTNSYTGVRADMAKGGFDAILLYTQPQIRRPDAIGDLLDNRHKPDDETRALQLFGGVAGHRLGAGRIEATWLRLEESDRPGRPTRDRNLDTYGLRLVREPAVGVVDYDIEGFAQSGETSRGLGAAEPRVPVRARYLHGEAGWSFRGPMKARIAAEFEYASGDRGGRRYERFDTLFGMRRAEIAPSGIYGTVSRANMISPGLRLEIAPSPRWDAFVGAKALWADTGADTFSTSAIRAGRDGRYAGLQVDTRLRYWVRPGKLRAEMDFIWLKKGDFLRNAPATSSGKDQRYLSLNLMQSF